MFTVTGQVLKVFSVPPGKTKTGENYGGDNRIQLLGEILMKNGESKNELITLTMPTKWGLTLFSRVGTTITLPVSLMASGNTVKAFIPEVAALPETVSGRIAK